MTTALGGSAIAATPSQLEQIVAGLTEGVILIEPDRRLVWANQAALALHGVSRLEDLGATVEEYQRNFVLRYREAAPAQPDQASRPHPVDRVLAGEAFDDVIVEVHHRDRRELDWTHRLRSLVIRDGQGRTERLALIVHDATEQVEAEERFERMFAANPAPALICRLADLRFVKVNAGFLDLTGYSRDEVLGRSVYDIDVLRQAENRDLAVERLRAGETIPQMEATLDTPRDRERHVIVAGQPIEIGDEPCMLFTFADLEDRHTAEVSLRETEARFEAAFRLSPLPTVIASADRHLRFLDVNAAFSDTFGFAAAEVVARRAVDLGLWVDEASLDTFEASLARSGSVRGVETRLRAKDGLELDCLVFAERVTIGAEPFGLCVFQDVTERRRTEVELIAAVEAVMADASWFSRGVVEKLANLRQPSRSTQRASGGLDALSAREREVLALLCEGRDDADIAAALRVARNTLRNHVASIYRKLGVRHRGALVAWARERGIGGDPKRLPAKARNSGPSS